MADKSVNDTDEAKTIGGAKAAGPVIGAPEGFSHDTRGRCPYPYVYSVAADGCIRCPTGTQWTPAPAPGPKLSGYGAGAGTCTSITGGFVTDLPQEKPRIGGATPPPRPAGRGFEGVPLAMAPTPQGAPPPIQRAASNTTPHPLASHPMMQMMRPGWRPPGIR